MTSSAAPLRRRSSSSMRRREAIEAVSYTHLDVYKRQVIICLVPKPFVLSKPFAY